MACFHPLEAWQVGKRMLFSEKLAAAEDSARRMFLPCGRCIGCREVRVRSWAIRCMHESQMHRESAFVTLTYDDAHYAPSLNYLDFQLFMKRLRKSRGRVRFFACGEYGEMKGRPHFHALLFGIGFRDGTPCGSNIYASQELSRLWPLGFSSVGSVTYDSAAYVAGYACKKVSGQRAVSHYMRVDVRTGEFVSVVPEFGRMSLKPGIGYTWFQKFWPEVYRARDGVVRKGGVVCPPPRYYDKLLEEFDPDLAGDKKFDRAINSLRFLEDCKYDRLLVRERCAKARRAFNNRRSL